MRVNVAYMAQMKRAAGCSSETIEVSPTATLRELVIALAERHGASLGTLLLDELNQPRSSLLFFVGEEHARAGHLLHEGDRVTILTPMAGG